MLDLSSLDLEEIANALSDQTDYEHRWLINPQTGEIVFWTAETGIDGQTPVDLGAQNDLIGAPEPVSIEAVLAAPNGGPARCVPRVEKLGLTASRGPAAD